MKNQYFVLDKPRQLGIFQETCPSTSMAKRQQPKDLPLDELRNAFIANYNQAKVGCINGNDVVYLPPSLPLGQMAKMQRKNYRTTRRSRQDCDEISLAARIAYGVYLGESPEKVFEDWLNALGVGNKGVFWSIEGELIGLRAKSWARQCYTFNKQNPFSSLPTAYALASVKKHYDGSVDVELEGFAYRYKITSYLRHGDYFDSVCPVTLRRKGVLRSPTEFRRIVRAQKQS